MPLSENEAVELSGELEALLRRVGLGWVVDQTQAQIYFGVPEEKAVPQIEEIAKPMAGQVLVDVGSYDIRQKPGKPVRFFATRPFTGAESVRLLVDAVDRVVVGLAAIESIMASEFGDVGATGTIRFVDDNETAAADELSYPNEERQAAVHELTAALAAVREVL